MKQYLYTRKEICVIRSSVLSKEIKGLLLATKPSKKPNWSNEWIREKETVTCCGETIADEIKSNLEMATHGWKKLPTHTPSTKEYNDIKKKAHERWIKENTPSTNIEPIEKLFIPTDADGIQTAELRDFKINEIIDYINTIQK